MKVKDGEVVGVWVKKDVHPLTTQPIHFTQDEQEDGGKANYLGDLQRACLVISKYVTYFETRDLPTKGCDWANILSIADDLDLKNNNTLVRWYAPSDMRVTRVMRVQTLLPQKLQSYVFNQYHDSRLGGGHHAHHRTWLRIKQDWWYPGMYNNIKNCCLACLACQA